MHKIKRRDKDGILWGQRVRDGLGMGLEEGGREGV